MPGALGSFQAGREAAGGGQYSGVTKGLDIGFQALLQKFVARRQEQAQTKELAQRTVFEEDPAQAYSVLGIEAPSDTTSSSTPDGMRPTKQTVTSRGGRKQDTYEAPEELNMTKLFDIYTKRSAEYHNNAIMRVAAARAGGNKNFVDKSFPTFDEWLVNSKILDTISKQTKTAKPSTEDEAPKVRSESTQSSQADSKVSPDIIQMQTADGKVVPVHKSRIAEAKKRGLKPVSK